MLGFQNQTCWGLVIPVRDPWAGETDVRVRPVTPCGCNSHPIWGLPTWGVWISTLLRLYPSCSSHRGPFFTSSAMGNLSCYSSDSCSVRRRNFGVTTGGGGLRAHGWREGGVGWGKEGKGREMMRKGRRKRETGTHTECERETEAEASYSAILPPFLLAFFGML